MEKKFGVGESKRAECPNFIHTNCRAVGSFPYSKSQPGKLAEIEFSRGSRASF